MVIYGDFAFALHPAMANFHTQEGLVALKSSSFLDLMDDI